MMCANDNGTALFLYTNTINETLIWTYNIEEDTWTILTRFGIHR